MLKKPAIMGGKTSLINITPIIERWSVYPVTNFSVLKSQCLSVSEHKDDEACVGLWKRKGPLGGLWKDGKWLEIIRSRGWGRRWCKRAQPVRHGEVEVSQLMGYPIRLHLNWSRRPLWPAILLKARQTKASRGKRRRLGFEQLVLSARKRWPELCKQHLLS